MSGMGMRRPVRNRNQLLTQTKLNTMKKKRRNIGKPPWDDTTKDLSVFKLTNQELQRKHELHQPKKNHERLTRKTYDTKLLMMAEGYSFNTTGGNYTENEEADIENSILEEYERIYKGAPYVTKAPNTPLRSGFMHDLSEMDQSYYDTLSKSVVRRPEINYCSEEEADCISGDDYDENEETSSQFQPNMNLDKYKQIIDESYSILQKERRDDKRRQQRVTLEERLDNVSKYDDVEVSGMSKAQQTSSKKSCLRNGKENDPDSFQQSSTTKSTKTFDDMNQMLKSLEDEINSYEELCGRKDDSIPKIASNSCQSYTASLLSMVTRLVRHLKESEKQLRDEIGMRSEILIAFEEQKSMIDALTTDLLDTQEENKLLKTEIRELKKNCQLQFASITMDLQKLQKSDF